LKYDTNKKYKFALIVEKSAIKNGNKPSNPNILAGFGISDVIMFRVKFLVL